MHPIINASTSTDDRECLRAETTESERHFQNCKHRERICVKQMAEAIEPMYYAELNNPDKGLKRIIIHNFLNLILDQYYDIGKTDIDDNITWFNESTSPSLSLVVYFQKQ